MNDFTFLTEEQIFGDNQLEILKKYGTKAELTDFAILLGGYTGPVQLYEGGMNRGNIGRWWTKSVDDDGHVCAVDRNGHKQSRSACERLIGARPALTYSSISLNSTNKVKREDGILEVEYGEYPQTVVSEPFSKILETAFASMSTSNTGMKTTGKWYTTDSVRDKDYHTSFQARTHTEYEYNGKKYIRFVGDTICEGEILSIKRIIEYGRPYWVEVEPIKWLVDEKTDIALSKKMIFSGIQFDRRLDYKFNFNRTDIKKFMDICFSKDIIPSIIKEITQDENKTIKMKIKL